MSVSKNIPTVLFVLAMSIMLLLAGCDTKKPYVRGDIDKEATEQGEKYWALSFTKCGDSFYGLYTGNNMIYQLKDPSVFTWHEMDDKTFTAADKLNHLEWVGKTFVHSKAYRSYKDEAWSDWFDHMPIGLYDKLGLPVRKIKGKWEFGRGENSERFKALSCDKIPNDTAQQ